MNRLFTGLAPAAILLGIFAAHSSDAIGQQTRATPLVGSWGFVSWYNISDHGKAMPQPVDGGGPPGTLLFSARPPPSPPPPAPPPPHVVPHPSSRQLRRQKRP